MFGGVRWVFGWDLECAALAQLRESGLPSYIERPFWPYAARMDERWMNGDIWRRGRAQGHLLLNHPKILTPHQAYIRHLALDPANVYTIQPSHDTVDKLKEPKELGFVTAKKHVQLDDWTDRFHTYIDGTHQ